MPNLMLSGTDRGDLIAYILSLRWGVVFGFDDLKAKKP
jgi:hypothetical protein